MGLRLISQFGSVFEGLATTNPAPAPGTAEPSGPILFKTPSKAIAFSAVMKDSRSLACSALGAPAT